MEKKKKEVKSHLVEDLEKLREDLIDLEHKVEEAHRIMSKIQSNVESLDKEENKWLEVERHIEERSEEIENQVESIEKMIEQNS